MNLTQTMPLSKTLLKDWPVLLILLLPFILIGYFWNQIPETIAMHWNAAGEVDRWGEKGWNVFLLPVMNVVTYMVMVVVPYIDPKRKTDNQQKALRVFRFIFPLFLSAVSLVMLYNWIGYDLQITNIILPGISILFLVLGNYLQTLKPNYFIGIRTPWTLESEENWRKTHRVGGKIWVGFALAMLISWFFVPDFAHSMIILVGSIAIAISTIGYSFYLYWKTGRVPDAE